jgi:molecular chaperone DnaK (HSP70)
MLAERMVSGGPPVLLDGLSMTLGLEVDDGYIARLLPRGAPFPASVTRTLDAGAVALRVLQGERRHAEDCRMVGTYRVETREGGRVRFSVDADGFIDVRAWDAQGAPCTVRLTR